ncbi:MAG: WecB/TagA/CpsF family glycosyltransferase [Prevotella sp.]|nr:WecB/TagA/CpsF family glycosyltransferase [Prevotella sp.]
MGDFVRGELNGVKIYPFTSVEHLLEFFKERSGILVAVNAVKVITANDYTRNIINNSVGYVDGVGVLKALRKKGFKDAVKIAGCDLWLEIIKKYQNEYSFYLVGGKQEVVDETVEKLRKNFPRISIVGHRNGYIKTDEERNALIEDIEKKKPNVIFVAMGSPKQELLMADMIKRHPAIYQGLGGSFDAYTGRVKRAPKWWIDHNLEFFYRFLKQPRRFKNQLYCLKFYLKMKLGKL